VNRVFYFSGHRLTVFHWDRKKFHGACSFEPNLEGLDKFKQYLNTSAKSPARLLVDVIEEDFRIETAPHVYGKDRKAVIGRLQDRHYRSSRQYVYSEVIGREKKGRRDDKVLIGGITNPGLVDIWKDTIEECRVPLIGIWTLPLLSKGMLPLIGEKAGAVLLVSQQVNSNLRQTFFRDGKMLSSRQSVINQDAGNISDIGKFAAPEVARTVAFLRNQRLIAADELVHVHIVGSESQIKSLQAEFKTDALNVIKTHTLPELQNKAGVHGLSGKYSDGILTWLCARQQAFQSHYGMAKEYREYYYQLGSKALMAASILLLLAAMLIAQSNFSSAIEHERSVELLRVQAEEYKKLYKLRFEEYEPVFEHARSMNAAVDMAERIAQHSRTSPLDFMIEISEVLSKPGLGIEHIDKIEWQAEQYKDLGDIKEVNKGKVDATVEDPVRHVGVIHGRINISDDNYRVSVTQVNRIIEALSQHERVEQVEVLNMPVEVRSEKAFTDESGLNVNAGSKKQKGRFALKVTMREPDHE